MPRRSRRGGGGMSVGRRPMRLLPGEKPQQRNAANARERARMRVLSKAFCRLKTTLPWVPPDTKLSKLDTLRLATSYIAHLRHLTGADDDAHQMLDAVDAAAPDHPHPTTLTWPYSFPRSVSQALKPHYEQSEYVIPDDDEDDDEDDDDGQWSQCSSQDSHQHARSGSESFLAHFTDVIMDIS